MDSTSSWKNLLDAHYTILAKGHKIPFRENFNLLKKKLSVFGRMKRPLAMLRISEISADGDQQALAFLCYVVESEACGENEDKTFLAFEHLFHNIPATEDVEAYVQNCALLASRKFPLIVVQSGGDTPKYFLYYYQSVIDLSTVCVDGGDVLLTFFKFHIVNDIPFAPAIAFFIDYVFFYLVAAPPQQGFQRPSDTSTSVHNMLMSASVRNYFNALNL